MIKAVIFDMDGLMVDTERHSYIVYRNFIRSYGKDLSLEEYASNFPGKPVNVAIQVFNKMFDVDCNQEEMHHFFEEHHRNEPYNPKTLPKKGLFNLLKYLKENNYKTSLATSSHKDRAVQIVGMIDALEYFDELTCGNEIQRGKPNPDIFLKACEKLGVDPSEALVLEDSESGIEAAYRGNIKVICIPDIIRPRDEIASMTTDILDSLDDVINYLETYNKGEKQ